MKDKQAFCENVFKIRLRDTSFFEKTVSSNGLSLILYVISNEEDLKDMHQMHMKMANAIIMLRKGDENHDVDKPTLFIRLGGKSQLENDGNLVVRSLVGDSYGDARDGVKELTKLIKQ